MNTDELTDSLKFQDTYNFLKYGKELENDVKNTRNLLYEKENNFILFEEKFINKLKENNSLLKEFFNTYQFQIGNQIYFVSEVKTVLDDDTGNRIVVFNGIIKDEDLNSFNIDKGFNMNIDQFFNFLNNPNLKILHL